jgi:Clr5 domain
MAPFWRARIRPGTDTFAPYEQQVSSVLVPTVPLFSPTPASQMVYTSFPSVASSSSNMRLQSDFPSSKAPNFANILQYHPPNGPQLKPESEGKSSQTRRPRTRTQHRVNPKDWEKYKAYIKKLYLEKGKTVTEIMADMSSHFKFSAS